MRSGRELAVGFVIGLTSLAALAGCNGQGWPRYDTLGPRGRFAEVGLYSPGKQWTKLATATLSQDQAAARTADDQVIVVTVDSATGEVRACGDLSGVCIGMNPWSTPLVTGRSAPVSLSAHQQPTSDDGPVANTADNEAAASGQ